ncbi:hypothetical protein RRG08_024360 [Elysia crispata]|uniref:Uncharacterized protein n=1 Tax=Elysia crispata TaxID=231223 RepID=A0AAE0ZM36_9GAST|nr:hypothetical protein RRG08_024360 [Elysia crispata]
MEVDVVQSSNFLTHFIRNHSQLKVNVVVDRGSRSMPELCRDPIVEGRRVFLRSVSYHKHMFGWVEDESARSDTPNFATKTAII